MQEAQDAQLANSMAGLACSKQETLTTEELAKVRLTEAGTPADDKINILPKLYMHYSYPHISFTCITANHT